MSLKSFNNEKEKTLKYDDTKERTTVMIKWMREGGNSSPTQTVLKYVLGEDEYADILKTPTTVSREGGRIDVLDYYATLYVVIMCINKICVKTAKSAVLSTIDKNTDALGLNVAILGILLAAFQFGRIISSFLRYYIASFITFRIFNCCVFLIQLISAVSLCLCQCRIFTQQFLIIIFVFSQFCEGITDGAIQCSETILCSKYFSANLRAKVCPIIYVFHASGFPLGAFVTYLLSQVNYKDPLNFYFAEGCVIGGLSMIGILINVGMPNEIATPANNYESDQNTTISISKIVEDPTVTTENEETVNIKNLILLCISCSLYTCVSCIIIQSFQQLMRKKFITNQSQTSSFFMIVNGAEVIGLVGPILPMNTVFFKKHAVTLVFLICIGLNLLLICRGSIENSKIIFVTLEFLQMFFLNYIPIAALILVADICAPSPIMSTFFLDLSKCRDVSNFILLSYFNRS